jgi:predicted transposase/invertase (TIGR01784 family)
MTKDQEKTPLNNPYDIFFKKLMKQRKFYLPFLSQKLPPHITSMIDMRTIRPSNAHFVEDQLRAYYSDCLFQARMKKSERSALIYVLIEHQSSVDKFIAFRIWHYIHAAWKQYLEDNPDADSLPLIVPVLFYQGRPEHNAALNIRELIQAPRDIVDKVFDEKIHFIDLYRIPDNELRARAELSAALLTMKHIKDETPPLRLVFEEIMRVPDSELRRRLILLVVLLFLEAGRDVTIEIINEQVNDVLGPSEKEVVVTGAEQLRREGHVEGRVETAIESLREGLDIGLISRITGLSPERIQSMKGKRRGSSRPESKELR